MKGKTLVSLSYGLATIGLLALVLNPTAPPTYAEGQTAQPRIEQAQPAPTSPESAAPTSPRTECTSMNPAICHEPTEVPTSEIADPMLPRKNYSITIAEGCQVDSTPPCEPGARLTYFGAEEDPAKRRFSLLIYAVQDGKVVAHDFTVDHLWDAQETYDSFRAGIGVER